MSWLERGRFTPKALCSRKRGSKLEMMAEEMSKKDVNAKMTVSGLSRVVCCWGEVTASLPKPAF